MYMRFGMWVENSFSLRTQYLCGVSFTIPIPKSKIHNVVLFGKGKMAAHKNETSARQEGNNS